MKVKIQDNFNGEIKEEEITPIYKCHHVNDRKYYLTLKDVKFDKTSEYILIKNPNSCYGFSALWLKDRQNKIYEYDGFGHSGACSVVCSLLQKLARWKMKIKQMMKNFLMKLGIYKYGKKLYYCTYLWSEREYEDDRWYDVYYLNGWQIFPVIRKVHGILMSGSNDELTKFYREQKKRLKKSLTKK